MATIVVTTPEGDLAFAAPQEWHLRIVALSAHLFGDDHDPQVLNLLCAMSNAAREGYTATASRRLAAAEAASLTAA